MTANTLPDLARARPTHPAATLGGFLRDRRARLCPAADAPARRRTPGLRREEVAARAGVSVTWYTWLEQGRGGPPSEEVLERLAGALALDADARELLFLLAQGRPPPVSPAPLPAVPPGLQRVLDAMPASPALVKTPAWDVVAWNAAALAVFGDGATPMQGRNILRALFDPAVKASLPDWESNARFAVAVFRIDVARVGGTPEATAVAAELQATSADFRRLWAENDARSHGFGLKRLLHPVAGLLTLEHSAFPVSGAEGLTMIVFTPLTPGDRQAVEVLIARQGQAA